MTAYFFVEKPVAVRAERLKEPRIVQGFDGVIRFEPGDWFVQWPHGATGLYRDEEFRQRFEPSEPSHILQQLEHEIGGKWP